MSIMSYGDSMLCDIDPLLVKNISGDTTDKGQIGLPKFSLLPGSL